MHLYLTIRTGIFDSFTTWWLTLPNTSSAKPPRPRLPMTTRSNRSSSASETMVFPGLPHKSLAVIFSLGCSVYAFFSVWLSIFSSFSLALAMYSLIHSGGDAVSSGMVPTSDSGSVGTYSSEKLVTCSISGKFYPIYGNVTFSLGKNRRRRRR